MHLFLCFKKFFFKDFLILLFFPFISLLLFIELLFILFCFFISKSAAFIAHNSFLFFLFDSKILFLFSSYFNINFDDNFGTYRIFLWKRTIPLIKDYSFLGSGPDTFALRFMPIYSDDIAKIGPLTINDTAANIYLTMFINLGIMGALSYIAFLTLQLYNGIKYKSSYSFVLLSSIICYMVSSFFNLSVVVISPLFWLLMAIHHLCLYDNE